jgi:hypothetical protein
MTNNVIEFGVDVAFLPDKRVFFVELEDFEKGVEGVDAVVVEVGTAGAEDVISDGGFVFLAIVVFEDEGRGTELLEEVEPGFQGLGDEFGDILGGLVSPWTVSAVHFC